MASVGELPVSDRTGLHDIYYSAAFGHGTVGDGMLMSLLAKVDVAK